MIVQLAYLLIQFVPPQNKPDAALHQKLYHVTDYIEKKPDPQNNESQGKNSTGLTDRIDFTVANRGQSDHRHINRIQNGPILYHHISHSSTGNQAYGKQNNYDEVGRAIQNTIRTIIRVCTRLHGRREYNYTEYDVSNKVFV